MAVTLSLVMQDLFASTCDAVGRSGVTRAQHLQSVVVRFVVRLAAEDKVRQKVAGSDSALVRVAAVHIRVLCEQLVNKVVGVVEETHGETEASTQRDMRVGQVQQLPIAQP